MTAPGRAAAHTNPQTGVRPHRFSEMSDRNSEFLCLLLFCESICLKMFLWSSSCQLVPIGCRVDNARPVQAVIVTCWPAQCDAAGESPAGCGVCIGRIGRARGGDLSARRASLARAHAWVAASSSSCGCAALSSVSSAGRCLALPVVPAGGGQPQGR